MMTMKEFSYYVAKGHETAKRACDALCELPKALSFVDGGAAKSGMRHILDELQEAKVKVV